MASSILDYPLSPADLLYAFISRNRVIAFDQCVRLLVLFYEFVEAQRGLTTHFSVQQCLNLHTTYFGWLNESTTQPTLSDRQIRRILALYFDWLTAPRGQGERHRLRNAARNSGTGALLESLSAAGLITIIKDKDCGIIPPVYTGAYFDSGHATRFPTKALANALLDEFDTLNKQRGWLMVKPEFEALIRAYHRIEGRSEAYSSFKTATALDLDFSFSSNGLGIPNERAESWRVKQLPAAIEAYCDEYEGDAEFTDGAEHITVCAPFVLGFHNGLQDVISFLERLRDRLHGRRFILCSPFGFRKYKKSTGRYPWEERTRSPYRSRTRPHSSP